MASRATSGSHALRAHAQRTCGVLVGVALFAPRCLEIKAVITDLDMPNLDGSALARIVRTMNPSVQMVTVSASAEPDDPRRHSPVAGTFLSKPFTSEMLLKTLNQLLGQKVLPEQTFVK